MLDHLVRPEITRLKAYEWELSTQQLAEAVGLEPWQIKRFDTNTSPYTLKTIMEDLAQEFPSMPVNEYPDTSYANLTQLAASYTKTDEEMIVIGAGADECIDITAKTFLGRETEAIIPFPTYSMFRIVSEIMGATVQGVIRQDDFSVDIDAVLNKINEKTRMIFLCNPNNPTANTTPRKDIERLLEQAQCMIFIDEAYFEFSGESAVDLTYEFENLIVLRTLSKAFCMAAMRVAYLVANRHTVQTLHKVRPPNSVCSFSVRMAEAALTHQTMIKKIVKSILQERVRFQAELDRFEEISTFPSDTNFLLVRSHKIPASDIYQNLLRKGLVTRNVSNLPLLENCLRITVRTREDDNLLLKSLKNTLQ